MNQLLQHTQNEPDNKEAAAVSPPALSAFFLSAAFACLLMLVLPQVSLAQLTKQWRSAIGPSGAGTHNNVISSLTDSEGNLLVLATSGGYSEVEAITLHKIDRAGNELWQAGKSNEPGVSEVPIMLRTDDEGNSYVLTRIYASPGVGGFSLAKYSPGGELAWSSVMEGATAGMVSVADLLPVGKDLYLAGNGEENESTFILLRKLNQRGKVLWEQRHEGATAHKLAADGKENIVLAGDVYVGAPTGQEPEFSNVLLLSYKAGNGKLSFEKNYNYTSTIFNGRDIPVDLHVSPQGEILVVSNSDVFGWNALTNILGLLKTDRNGNKLWQTTMSTTNESRYRDAVFATDGSVVLLATEVRYRRPSDYSIAKISAQGERLWFKLINDFTPEAYRVNGDTIRVVEPVAIAMDKAGNIAMTGETDRKVMGIHSFLVWEYHVQPTLFTRLYSKDGEQLWEDAVKAEPGHATIGGDVVIDAADNLYVLGTETDHESDSNLSSPPTYRNVFAIRYSPQQACNTPVDVKLYLPPYAMKVGEQVRTTADFGEHILNEDTGVRWTWGDNTTPSMSFTAFGTPRITGWQRYGEAGIYTIGLDVSESCLKPASDDYTQEMVIFDPAAGNASGAGLLHSPVGQLDLMQTAGTAAFAFAARYTNSGAHAKPSGAALLLLNSSNVLFSNSLDWLVIKGGRAALQGTGTVNGKGRYRFVATMEDGKGAGLNDASDMMRLQVWDMDAHGKLVYDNAAAMEQRLSLTQPLPAIKGGQVLINHRQVDPLFAVYLQQALEGSTPLTDVVAYPNPFTSRTTIAFSLEQDGDYSVDLYDLKGTLIRRVKQGTATAKADVYVEVDATGLSKGIYLARLQTDTGVKTLKLVVDK